MPMTTFFVADLRLYMNQHPSIEIGMGSSTTSLIRSITAHPDGQYTVLGDTSTVTGDKNLKLSVTLISRCVQCGAILNNLRAPNHTLSSVCCSNFDHEDGTFEGAYCISCCISSGAQFLRDTAKPAPHGLNPQTQKGEESIT